MQSVQYFWNPGRPSLPPHARILYVPIVNATVECVANRRLPPYLAGSSPRSYSIVLPFAIQLAVSRHQPQKFHCCPGIGLLCASFCFASCLCASTGVWGHTREKKAFFYWTDGKAWVSLEMAVCVPSFNAGSPSLLYFTRMLLLFLPKKKNDSAATGAVALYPESTKAKACWDERKWVGRLCSSALWANTQHSKATTKSTIRTRRPLWQARGESDHGGVEFVCSMADACTLVREASSHALTSFFLFFVYWWYKLVIVMYHYLKNSASTPYKALVFACSG